MAYHLPNKRGWFSEMHEEFRGRAHFEDCAEFCEKYDQAALDANCETVPLEFFEPMIRREMERPNNRVYVLD